jgi:hypothetical protein
MLYIHLRARATAKRHHASALRLADFECHEAFIGWFLAQAAEASVQIQKGRCQIKNATTTHWVEKK